MLRAAGDIGVIRCAEAAVAVALLVACAGDDAEGAWLSRATTRASSVQRHCWLIWPRV